MICTHEGPGFTQNATCDVHLSSYYLDYGRIERFLVILDSRTFNIVNRIFKQPALILIWYFPTPN